MKSRTSITCLLLCVLFLALFPTTVFANSSWGWFTETRPYDILPFVALVTVVVETFLINHFAKIHRLVMTSLVVIFGNLLSFAAPFVCYYLWCLNDDMYPFLQYMEYLPSYIVGIYYLVLTLAVEVPICYTCLKRDCDQPKKLLKVIIWANVITTVFVAIVERIVCPGQW